jgi:hypothetical protein
MNNLSSFMNNSEIVDLIHSQQHCVSQADLQISPTNGSEPNWNPTKWKVNQKNNNCFAYAVDDHDPSVDRRWRKPVPQPHPVQGFSCSNVTEGLYEQIPNIYPTMFECQCTDGYQKIYYAVSDDDPNDFHFWRQDHDGTWSHKVGARFPSQVDAENKPILNPEQSNRSFPSHNYAYGCGFYCVPHGTKLHMNS